MVLFLYALKNLPTKLTPHSHPIKMESETFPLLFVFLIHGTSEKYIKR